MHLLCSLINIMFCLGFFGNCKTLFQGGICLFFFFSEDFIALAILRLIEEEKAVVEGAGVTAFAAVLAGMLPELQDRK